ncbi:hypothetical protein POSPLADRAFT_1068040 [Postia placenta MAD-698-R-SB12]|uniref:F-box domain-containing protein n=1 Tax=Postia placenta MAD-698-R-SB12 TaxID=670580 RepID=A0A1X6MKJ5_9APHY|nr:hypothetical protein POSPLADRAFT_1068040 [Postia placenta MAD-698-R-SB12]OSX56838.1 hypothetical protein POSPLADRAFT_1068040 [Postia placenta MAD-698-R-SB12]
MNQESVTEPDRLGESRPADRRQPTLPIEVCERVLDHLWFDSITLKACTLVCKFWYTRSRYHLLATTDLKAREHVVRFARLVRFSAFHSGAVSQVRLRGTKAGASKDERMPSGLVGIFATMLAGKLPQLKELNMWDINWKPSAMHADVFLHLSAFVSITLLVLDGVTFPSVQLFGRLVCSLRGLEQLACYDVTFTDPGFDAAAFHVSPSKLSFLSVDGDGTREIIDFFVSTMGPQLEMLRLGMQDPQDAISVSEASTLGIPQLLQACGLSLRQLGIAMKNYELLVFSTIAAKPVDLHAFLAHNHGLEEIWLCTQLRGKSAWIPLILSGITSKKMKAIRVWVDGWSDDLDVLRRIQSFPDPPQHSSIDELLSTDKFPYLQKLEIELHLRGDHGVPLEEHWRKALVLQLPKLHARGILHASVRKLDPLDPRY